MAPRMKLVRRASRDLSADIQASTGHILLNKRMKHGPYHLLFCEGVNEDVVFFLRLNQLPAIF